MNKALRYGIFLLLVPISVALGVFMFGDRQYVFISLVVAVLSCIPFFMAFEREREGNAKRLIVLAVLVSLSVLGRFIFFVIPFFKPVTAMVVITAVYFGPEMGFLCGALSAVLSNFYFGQGPWTPFQMFTWGLIGLIAGMLARRLVRSRALLAVFGVFAGILFSLVMDIWSVLWIDGSFNFARYLAAAGTALPVTAVYAVSNTVFLLFMLKPMGAKLERIKIKYGL